jgi:hypothetical protein
MSNMTFVKLFSTILDSSIWSAEHHVVRVWVTLLAMCDAKGRVSASVPGLARRANATREETDEALAMFLSPDPDSRTKEKEGRRIEEIDGGWQVINYKKYREARNEDERREYNREWMKNKREAEKAAAADPAPKPVKPKPAKSSAKDPAEPKKVGHISIQRFVDIYRLAFGMDPTITPIDAKGLKSAYESGDNAEHWDDILEEYFAMDTPFLRQNGWGGRFLQSSLNGIRLRINGKMPPLMGAQPAKKWPPED